MGEVHEALGVKEHHIVKDLTVNLITGVKAKCCAFSFISICGALEFLTSNYPGGGLFKTHDPSADSVHVFVSVVFCQFL